MVQIFASTQIFVDVIPLPFRWQATRGGVTIWDHEDGTSEVEPQLSTDGLGQLMYAKKTLIGSLRLTLCANRPKLRAILHFWNES